MTVLQTRRPRVAARFLVGFALLGLACTDAGNPASPFAPQFTVPGQQGLEQAIAVQERHTAALMRMPGVVGTAVGLTPTGLPRIRVFLARPAVAAFPAALEGVPVSVEVTGLIMARQDPTQRMRPAPIGFSVGHPLITAGSIGGRVVDASGNVHILSNNHVLAAMNDGRIGDAILQPGAYDGGTLPGDQVGTLSSFQPINFSGGNNLMDAALARTTTNDVANTTSAEGYGMPTSSIWGDADGNGVFDNRNALLNLAVQKYGRTTRLTQGQVTAVNGSFSVCYDGILWICFLAANFVDQVVIEPGVFSGGGDSGSLIVSLLGNQPVGLLFAGSETFTIANRIDHVLNHFGVAIDDGATPPADPVLDVAVTAVNAPVTASEGDIVDVVVSVRNAGNVDATAFVVTLNDDTDGVLIGTRNVAALTAGQTTNLTFQWNTSGGSIGPHSLVASHDLADANAGNDVNDATVQLNVPGTLVGVHVGDLDGWNMSGGNPWDAVVEVTIHDANHQPLNGVTVVGQWKPSGLASDTCVTGELGGLGSCIFLSLSNRRKQVTFTVMSVTIAGQIYEAAANHDPDGDSDGVVIVVNR